MIRCGDFDVVISHGRTVEIGNSIVVTVGMGLLGLFKRMYRAMSRSNYCR
jgi:hypothetical protein